MVMQSLTSYRFDTLAQTITKLNEEECLLIAGGTDVMVQSKNRRGVPAKIEKPVVFIDHLSELKQIYMDGRELHIGACSTYQELLINSFIPTILKKAIREIAAPAIRNRGTLGGNICNASPAGDTLPLLYIFNTKLLLRSIDGERIIGIEEFIQGPRRIARNKNEILVEVILPELDEKNTHFIFEKVANRKADAISKISFAGMLQVTGNKIKDARFAFGAVGPTMVRSLQCEKKIIDKEFPLEEGILNEVVADFATIIHPIDDQRSTAFYRKIVAQNLLRYFLEAKGRF
ncbi:FAD binding domain-containing protein [Robertmurraya massiliosenegalensis]|uniref:FAD binding domain-containing protein n=1 Tax=Robertmurraya massiliosenegalensis TaxID=1287657 RepID=UPI0002FAB2EF|nr:FAD binding domain-containing protein [Robertmurraya massiliosenegalensis]